MAKSPRRPAGPSRRFAASGGSPIDPHVRRTSDPAVIEAEGLELLSTTATPPANRFAARDFGRLLGMEGFSDSLLKNHFTLYQGYVKNANQLLDDLEELHRAGALEGARYAEVKRRFGWEWNGIRLHELYFENLTRERRPLDPASKLGARISADFGGTEAWAKDFHATGAMRGIGWAVLCVEPLRNRLFNAWIDEHDAGHLAGATPLLVMDVFEHAFMLDYGVNKADYIDSFFQNIHWDAVALRLG